MRRTPKTADEDARGGGRVFLKRDPEGGWRRCWYGRFMRNGKSRETSLCPWQGTPPDNPAKEAGNAAFEQSRERARKMLADYVGGRNEADDEIRDARKAYALMYGHRIDRVKLADLWTRWNALPHKAGLSAGWRELVRCVLERFVKFMGNRFPSVKEAGALTAAHFEAFFEYVAAPTTADPPGLGLSARSWNYHLTILRGVLKKVDGGSTGFREYLSQLPARPENTIHRRPFSGEELEAIFAAAGEVDPELRPVLVAAACTALRRGDVARLRWDAVDLGEGFVTVQTTKTGETVEIPIFPPFRAVLEEAAKTRRQGVPFVFPKIALAYKRGPGELDRRLNKVLSAAGFSRPSKTGTGGKYPAPQSSEDAIDLVEAGMRAARWTDRRMGKGLEILRHHLDGEDGRTIARELGVGASSVSEYLHAMEEVGEIALVTPPKAEATAKATLAAERDGEQRQRRGSLCGWHSFRTTFCTLALQNGVPMEILRKITGHRTAEIVLKHYDRRGREAMKKAIGTAMPQAIAGAVAGTGNALQAAGPSSGAVAEEFEAVPADVAKVARMLAAADAATLAKVAAMLKGAAR